MSQIKVNFLMNTLKDFKNWHIRDIKYVEYGDSSGYEIYLSKFENEKYVITSKITIINI